MSQTISLSKGVSQAEALANALLHQPRGVTVKTLRPVGVTITENLTNAVTNSGTTE